MSFMNERVSVLWRALLLLIALLVIAAGAQAARNPKDEKVRIVPADQARARSVGLRRADFPAGWTVEPNTPSAGWTRCPGISDPDMSGVTITGRATSPLFSWTAQTAGGQMQVVGSFAEVYARSAHLALEWRVGISDANLRCIEKRLKQEVSGIGQVEASYPSTKLVFPRVAPRQAGRRWQFKLSGAPSIAGVDVVALGRERELININIVWLGRKPDKALETRLVRVTGKRLAKAFP